LKAENIVEVAQLLASFFMIDYAAKVKQLKAEVEKSQVSNSKSQRS
jgi:hypothetical protein